MPRVPRSRASTRGARSPVSKGSTASTTSRWSSSRWLEMLPSATALSTQQLAEFLAVVSAVHDGLSATRMAVERAARALEAEVAVVLGDGDVVSSVGFPLGRVPVAELAEVVAGDRWLLDVPGAGLCHTA